MKTDDLTRLKHIGPSRMKLLNDFGITTIDQLNSIPLKRLAGISSIGEHYAKLIKSSVAAYYAENSGSLPGKALPVAEAKVPKIDRKFGKKIATLNRKLNRANEDLKPLWKKKYLEQYINFKKRAKRLKALLEAAGNAEKSLSKKTKKKITKKTAALESLLKKTGKKPQKKKYREIIREIQSFSKMLQEVLP